MRPRALGRGRGRRALPLTAAALLAVGAAGAAPPRVDVRAVQALPCTRPGIATSLMAFLALANERRFADTRLLWLPKRRLPTPGFFAVRMERGLIRENFGRDIPDGVARWFRRSGVAQVLMLDPRVNRAEPANNGYALDWIRLNAAGVLVYGTAKGVWDCEKRRIAMFVGSEQPHFEGDDPRAVARGHCGRRPVSAFVRYGQRALMCALPRGARP